MTSVGRIGRSHLMPMAKASVRWTRLLAAALLVAVALSGGCDGGAAELGAGRPTRTDTVEMAEHLAGRAGMGSRVRLHRSFEELLPNVSYRIDGDAPLTLTDHRLVNLRFAVADVRREADGKTYHARVAFRAVTEPA